MNYLRILLLARSPNSLELLNWAVCAPFLFPQKLSNRLLRFIIFARSASDMSRLNGCVELTLYLLEARKMLMRALCSLFVTWSCQSTEQIRGFPAAHWGPSVRRITRNFCLCRIPLCIIILLIMLHMKRKATGGMNHVLVSLVINNWDRVRSLWELLVPRRWFFQS